MNYPGFKLNIEHFECSKKTTRSAQENKDPKVEKNWLLLAYHKLE